MPNKKYTSEFKQKAVETMRSGKLSYYETARGFDIGDIVSYTLYERPVLFTDNKPLWLFNFIFA